MRQCDREVLSVYSEIFSLDSANEQLRALTAWWQYLEDTCSRENPCIECQRELEPAT